MSEPTCQAQGSPLERVVRSIGRLNEIIEKVYDEALEFDLPKYPDFNSRIGAANLSDALSALRASSRSLRALRDQLEDNAPNDKVWHGGENGCQSEAKEGRCPPLPLPSCSFSSSSGEERS